MEFLQIVNFKPGSALNFGNSAFYPLFENDFTPGCFFVSNLMARSPLSVFQILGFDMKLAVRENLGRAQMSDVRGRMGGQPASRHPASDI